MSPRLVAPLWPLVALAAWSCGGSTPPPAAPPATQPAGPAAPASQAAAVPLEDDTPQRTASGATFVAPKGWLVTTGAGGEIRLEDPDRELQLTFLEISGGEGQAAIDAAWQRAQPGFARKVRDSVSPPAREGWDAVMQTNYETTDAEQRLVSAAARRKGSVWYVTTLDGTMAAVDRRGAQVQLAVGSFKAPGLEGESFAGKKALALDGARAAAFDAFVAEAMEKLHIPGASIAVVQGGKVVFEKGYGVRTLKTGAKVTPRTLFLVGSISKSFTTLLMAILVDEGKLRWDTPAVEIMPSFALGDPEVTRKLTVRHTVCACTGMPRQDLEMLFEYAKATPESRIASMASMKPTTGFGETFQYSNPMVTAGGFLAAHALYPRKTLAAAYASALADKILRPLGMAATTVDFGQAGRREHAMPHAEDLRRKVQPLPLSDENIVITAAPAGGIWSSARDMTHLLLLELARGKTADGKQLVSEANLLERRKPQVKIDERRSYGLGLALDDYHDLAVVSHSGNTLGFTADMVLFPEQDLGMVVLANLGAANTFRNVVRRRLIEVLFGAKEEAAQNLDFSIARLQEVVDKELPKINFAPDEAWLKGLVGVYQNPDLGKVIIRLAGTGAVFDAGEWHAPLGQLREDDGTTKVILLEPPVAGFDLLPGEKDGKKTLTINAPQQVYVFEEQKP